MAPSVSVAIPVFNGERYIREAIDSILSQTFQDIELLIVDNASTDATPRIATEYEGRDARVRYFRFRENYGPAHNWNASFKLSTGRYFKWAAYDDVCAPEFIGRCVSALEQNADAVLAYPLTVGIDEMGQRIAVPAMIGPGYGKTDNYRDQNQGTFRQLVSQNPVTRFAALLEALWNAHILYGLIRSDVLARTSLHPSHYAGDHLLLTELSLHGPFLAVAEELFFLRIHTDRTSQTQSLSTLTEERRRRASSERWWKIRRGYPQRVKAYFDAVASAPLSRLERMRCYAEILKAVARWSSARLARDR